MKRTTNAELLQVAMNYLPLYDLSVKKMSEDYLSYNYGDFLTRFLYRMAYEAGRRVDIMPLDEMITQCGVAMEEVASDIHVIIDDKKNDSLGVLSPSCEFLHQIREMKLVKLQFDVLYPLLAHYRRNDEPAFMECENPKLLLCYPKATQEDLFRMSKIVLHNSCGNDLKDLYVGILSDFVKLYQALEFQIAREYSDFAEWVGVMRVECDKDLYNKSQNLWEYKVCHAIGFESPESEFQESLEKFRSRFGQLNEGHIMYIVDMFLHSNTGMMDSKFGVKAIACLDYYLSLRVPLDEIKEVKSRT